MDYTEKDLNRLIEKNRMIEKMQIRLAELKELETYYDGFLISDYTSKQFIKIYKEMQTLRAKLKDLGVNLI